MASNVTLAQLKQRARERCDMVNSTFISDAELTSFINSSVKELYDRLLDAGEFYYMSTATINIVANTAAYDLPTDFYKMLGVDLVVDAQGNGVTLKPFQFEQRNAYLFTPTWNVVGLSYLRYMIQANKIKFVPVPNGSTTVKIYYAPAFTNLSANSDTFDGINGWEEYVVIETAIKMLIKEESDPQALMLQKQEITQRIDSMKHNRDYGSASRIADVTRTLPWEYWQFGVNS